MTRAGQTADEMDAVRRLAYHVPELANLPCQPGANPPDVIVGDIGIEVTEFHRVRGSSPLIAIEKEQARITRAAWKEYERRAGPPQYVQVRFSPKALPRGQSAEIAKHLASAVLRVVPCTSSLRIRGEELPPPLSSCLQRIVVGPGGGWNCIGGGSGEPSWDVVERLVRTKEEDLASWPADGKRRWLLIEARATEEVDGQQALLFSSMFPHAPVLPRPTLRTGFDRVYFSDVVTGQVTQVA